MSRQTKTPRQRAQEQLDVASRLVDRLAKKRDQLQAEIREVIAEYDAAEARRDYLAGHPDLDDPAQMSSDDAIVTES